MEKAKQTVLVVDDVELNRTIFEKIFVDTYTVLKAENGQKALEVLSHYNVDLVLLDIEMPIMNGYEVITTMRATPQWKRIPIIVTTGAIDRSERKAFDLGADEFIQQPYDPYIVRKRVDNLLERYALQIEHFKGKALAAEKENKAKTDFLSRISHDIRTPLNGILGLASLLKKDISKDNIDALNDVQQLEMSGYYLLNLINDTLDVNKISSGKMELNASVCDTRTLFTNIAALIKPNMDAKNIKFKVNVMDIPLPLVYIDIGRIEQITMNILSNASKFTPEGGSVEMKVSSEGIKDDSITYTVQIKDNGVGISTKFLEHIFDPFVQEHQDITPTLQGTGLGMTIAKQFTELMGGNIKVESEVGKGTTVTCVLPMVLATEEQIRQWKEVKLNTPINCSLEGKRVLLCEDNNINVMIATRLLSGRGLLVEHAENGSVGLEMFKKAAPNYYDLILMDVRMPVMDGIQATMAIRDLPREDAQTIPIIAMTANAFASDVRQVKEAGMNNHIAKPIVVNNLFTTLEQELSLSRSIKKQTLLVVDDIEINRAVIKETLRNDYIVLEAEDGKQALQLLEEHKGIDVMITDIQMPNMDGVELIRQVRKNPAWKHLTIVANTQFGDPSQEQMLLEIGADDFVYKPTTPKIVEIRVRNALKKI